MPKTKFLVAAALVALCAVLLSGGAFAQDSFAVKSQHFPAAMTYDAAADVSVGVTNDGTTTWDSDYALLPVEGVTAAASRIDTWGITSVPVSGTVAPDADYLFEFSIVAPPITTLEYPAPVAPETAGVISALDCNWILASQVTPTTAAMITTDTAVNHITIDRFPDILPGTAGAWAAFWIEELAGRVPVMVSGYPDGNYAPRVAVSRDQMAVFVARALNLALPPFQNRFPDVAEDYWARPWIEALAGAGIVQGYPDGNYAPLVNVSRDQMAVFVARGMAGSDDAVPNGPPTPTFPDVPTDYWAYKYVEYCYGHGIVSGYPDGNYAPRVNVTRDQMAVFVWRAFVAPTGTPIVLAGPGTTSFDPAATAYDGWSTTRVDPSYAYVAFDALRLDTNLITSAGTADWDVYFDIYEYDDLYDTPSGAPVATVSVSVTEAEMLAAKAAAAASGNPYLVVSAPIPTTLANGAYQLVVRAEYAGGVAEFANRKPLFWVGTQPPQTIVAAWGKDEALDLLGGAVNDSTPSAGYSEAAMAKSDNVYFRSQRNSFPESETEDWCNWNHAHAIVFRGVPSTASWISITLEYKVNTQSWEPSCCDRWGDGANGNANNCCDSWGNDDGDNAIWNETGHANYGWGCRVMSGADGGNWQDQWWDENGSGDINAPADNDVQGGGELYDHIGFAGHPWVDTTFHWGTTHVSDYVTDDYVLVVFCGGSYQYLWVDQAVLRYKQ